MTAELNATHFVVMVGFALGRCWGNCLAHKGNLVFQFFQYISVCLHPCLLASLFAFCFNGVAVSFVVCFRCSMFFGLAR